VPRTKKYSKQVFFCIRNTGRSCYVSETQGGVLLMYQEHREMFFLRIRNTGRRCYVSGTQGGVLLIYQEHREEVLCIRNTGGVLLMYQEHREEVFLSTRNAVSCYSYVSGTQ